MNEVPSNARVLRKLYLTLFLRGRTSRGLRRETAPRSVGGKLAMTLVVYTLFGLLALFLHGQGTFTLSLYLHGMTFVFLGMFIAASAGEILFNKEEGEILMHRPIDPRAVLWAKVAVLVQVSLWLAGAFNLPSLVAGFSLNPLFPLAHALSTLMAAVLCASGVVLAYQLCLRWFGREKLENLMTGAQIVMAIGLVIGGQVIPQVMRHLDMFHGEPSAQWWIWVLPPAWFAGFDEVLGGHVTPVTVGLGGLAIVTTLVVPWLAFGKLADAYQEGVQILNESAPARPGQAARRQWLDRLMALPPLCWLLRDPLTRQGFRLTAAYMLRDRETKLRLYPGVAPVLVMPLVFFLQGSSRIGNGFGIVFSGSYMAVLPMMALGLLQYSQHWQAADLFRAAPVPGPAPFIHGARHAVMWLLVLPMVLGICALALFLLPGGLPNLLLLLPGIIALPAYGMVPGAVGQAIPLSMPAEEARAAGRGARLTLALFSAMALGGLATLARSLGWFEWFLAGEAVLVVLLCLTFRAAIRNTAWPAAE
ncbi:hypothetical protein [Luteolibacter sp. LG18]|uniref:hypothetical protein n=1 Tax=Luteolibacter sp. LG18 TaxID=2819286 RepID=UPI002B318A10|nr:hypothetical protein llg_11580 [Luteolibacter sp. LG18]